ncbi:MAG: hypothetical protein P1P84_22090 [Deferrisomatales bacterium]|nr:hypothetical protein [Deferrisomatales bacterium]
MRATIVACLVALGAALPLQTFAEGLPGVDVDLTTEYRYQWAQRHAGEDETDQDVRVGVGLEAAPVGWDRLNFAGLLYYSKDLDGTSASGIYKDLLDSYDDRQQWQLYRAALRYRADAYGLALTAGRQEVWGAEVVTLDGARLDLAPCRWVSLDLYGGRRASFYSDPDTEAVYGGDLELRPWQGGSLQLRDLYYLANSLELAVVQVVRGWGSGRAALRMIGNDARDATLSAHLYPWREGEVHLHYLRVYKDYDYDFTSDDDDLVPALELGEQQPYADYGLTVRQGLLDVAGIGARLRRHNVIQASDEDATNVDFNEGALLGDLTGWPWKGLRLDGEVIRWVEDRERENTTEDEMWGFVARVSQDLAGHTLGASYFKRAYDSDGGARDTRGYDLWARVEVLSATHLYLRYEREVDDLYRQDGIDALNVFTARLDLAF